MAMAALMAGVPCTRSNGVAAAANLCFFLRLGEDTEPRPTSLKDRLAEGLASGPQAEVAARFSFTLTPKVPKEGAFTRGRCGSFAVVLAAPSLDHANNGIKLAERVGWGRVALAAFTRAVFSVCVCCLHVKGEGWLIPKQFNNFPSSIFRYSYTECEMHKYGGDCNSMGESKIYVSIL